MCTMTSSVRAIICNTISENKTRQSIIIRYAILRLHYQLALGILN